MRHHPDLGQTSTTYLGAVALAAGLVAALLAVGVPHVVAEELRRAVCTVVERRGCGVRAGQEAIEVEPPTPLEVATAGRLVVLGDSFTSGEGAYDYEPSSDTPTDRCHRSTNAYAYELAGELDFAGGADFVACSGARTEHVLREGQRGEPRQIDAVTPEASLVTIGIGGNDIGWPKVLFRCVRVRYDACRAGEAELDRALERAAASTGEVYEAARDRAGPDARIVAVGYPRFFPTEPVDDQYDYHVGPLAGGISTAEQRYLNDQTRDFNALLAAEAEEAGVEFVDLTDVFEGHEAGSHDSWFQGVDLWDRDHVAVDPETFHPNARGQAAMAEAIRRQVERPER